MGAVGGGAGWGSVGARAVEVGFELSGGAAAALDEVVVQLLTAALDGEKSVTKQYTFPEPLISSTYAGPADADMVLRHRLLRAVRVVYPCGDAPDLRDDGDGGV